MIDASGLTGTFIRFIEVIPTKPRKTRIFEIWAKDGSLLGQIRWYASWRTYAFFPESDLVFEPVCLSEIVHAISLLMEDRGRTP